MPVTIKRLAIAAPIAYRAMARADIAPNIQIMEALSNFKLMSGTGATVRPTAVFALQRFG
ncbi:hypothetical protein CAL28_22470 [Bordetella genomosp. 11]|uniref:Uncharacterized protein n=1 Tax=Bordetella genomosp. 11 TaxID=1416808 RepID=A0A261UJA6_9BORD|nr:hypothetical protein CAL28_22470 [Bordetella genomosp. 11]